MGTRGNVVVMEAESRLVRIYRQYDTYPKGLGADLKRILCPDDSEPKLVNGFGTGDENPAVFNGMSDLAAYLVGALKREIGNVYLSPVDREPDGCMIEWVYTLYAADRGPSSNAGDEEQSPAGDAAEARRLFVKIETIYGVASQAYRTIYDGPLAEMDPEAVERDSDEAE